MTASAAEIDALLQELRAVLDEEFAALHQRQSEQLAATVERKKKLLSELEAATGKYCRDGGKLPPEWSGLRDLAVECAQRNQINGGAIALNRNLVAGLMDTLIGGQRRDPTYDAFGKTGGRIAARQVGRV